MDDTRLIEAKPHAETKPRVPFVILILISAKIVLTSWNDGYALCNGARINFSDIERVHGTDGNDIVRAGKAQKASRVSLQAMAWVRRPLVSTQV